MKTLKVGIGYTKRGTRGQDICDAFANGVQKNLDKPILIKTPKQMQKVDVMVQLCPLNIKQPSNSPDWKLRKAIYDFCNKRSIRRIIIDVGFIANKRWDWGVIQDDKYHSVSFDDIKGYGKYYPKATPDRFKQLGVKLAPWRIRGNHILILGQNHRGISVSHIDYNKWVKSTCQRLKTMTDRPIVFRPHPNVRTSTSTPEYVQVSEYGRPVATDLKNCWATVCCTTNGACDAIMAGIPLFTTEKMCIAYDVANHNLDRINDPWLPDRTRFINELAYCQWSTREFRNGWCWRHLRQFI